MLLLVVCFCLVKWSQPFLYPQQSETRDTSSLNGFWYFYVPTDANLTKENLDVWSQLDLEQVFMRQK